MFHTRGSFLPVVTASMVSLGLGAGCGDDAVGSDDAGAVPFPDGGVEAAPPGIPWLDEGVPPIGLAPCPAGWRELAEDGVTLCDSYPEGGRLDCPDGEAHFPGEPGCVPVGAPCPAGDFAADLPVDRRIVYVQPGALAGDGSEAAPYGSVAGFSLTTLPVGSVIALSRGTHRDPLRIVRGLVFRGACAAETLLTVPADAAGGTAILARDAVGEARDLSVVDSPTVGVTAVGSAASLRLEGVAVRGLALFGLFADLGAQLIGEAIVVRDTRTSLAAGRFGRALNLQNGATAELNRTVFGGNHETGVFASDPGTRLAASDVLVRDTMPRDSDRGLGRGLAVQDGAVAQLDRTVLDGNRDTALFSTQRGAVLTASDVVVRDTRPQESDSGGGLGLQLDLGAVVSMERVLFDRNHAAAILAGADVQLTLSDSVARDTESRQTDQMAGRGLSVQSGASADIDRAAFLRNRDVAVLVSEPGTTLTLADAVIRDTRRRERDETNGRGLVAQRGATADLSRLLLDRNRCLGLLAHASGALLRASDVVVRDTQSDARDGTGGRGLDVEAGATAHVSRGLFERNREIGVFATAESTVTTLSDVVIRETLPRECSLTTCAGAPAGHGLGIYDAAALRMERFVVADSNLCGVQIAREGQVDLEVGRVQGHPIGMCLQVEGYDTARLSNRVFYVDNGTNFDATTLPIPDAMEVDVGL